LKQREIAQIVSMGGIFTTLTVMFQATPVLLPSIGLLFSPLSTLPVALSAMYSVFSGTLTLLSGTVILLFISPQEAVIFLLTTGPLGLALGIQLNKGTSTIQTLIVSATTLFLGINVLTHVVGIAAFGGLTHSFSIYLTAMVFILFSLGYTSIWMFLLKHLLKSLLGIKQFSHFFDSIL